MKREDTQLWFYEGSPLRLHGLTTVEFFPKWLSADFDHPVVRHHNTVRAYDSLLDFCRREKPKKILMYRTYAIGDILMLIPVVSAMLSHLKINTTVFIAIERRYMEMIGESNNCREDIQFIASRGAPFDYGCDVHIDLNGALEADHRGGDESEKHRLELYGDALGMEIECG